MHHNGSFSQHTHKSYPVYEDLDARNKHYQVLDKSEMLVTGIWYFVFGKSRYLAGTYIVIPFWKKASQKQALGQALEAGILRDIMGSTFLFVTRSRCTCFLAHKKSGVVLF